MRVITDGLAAERSRDRQRIAARSRDGVIVNPEDRRKMAAAPRTQPETDRQRAEANGSGQPKQA